MYNNDRTHLQSTFAELKKGQDRCMPAWHTLHGPGKELKLKNCPAATGVGHNSKGTQLPYSKRCLASDTPQSIRFPCTQPSRGENADNFGEDRKLNLEFKTPPENAPGESRTCNLMQADK